jgi:DNA replication protein DnaC
MSDVPAVSTDRLLKSLNHAPIIQAREKEFRALLAVDLLIVDDFALDAMDAQESRDAHEIIFERHRAGSMIITSNRGPGEWLPTFADPMCAQAAIDRLTSTAHDLVNASATTRSHPSASRRSSQGRSRPWDESSMVSAPTWSRRGVRVGTTKEMLANPGSPP